VAELGVRYKCYKCETKFYDLGRPQPICPSCGEDQNNREVRQILKRKKRRSSLKAEPDIHPLPEEHDALIDHDEHESLPDAEDKDTDHEDEHEREHAEHDEHDEDDHHEEDREELEG
jgi:hypothetical protein